jgi:hypothetical protein
LYEQYGYAYIHFLPDIGTHAIGKYHMIGQNVEKEKHVIPLTAIRRKGHLISINSVQQPYAVVPQPPTSGRKTTKYHVLCLQ